MYLGGVLKWRGENYQNLGQLTFPVIIRVTLKLLAGNCLDLTKVTPYYKQIIADSVRFSVCGSHQYSQMLKNGVMSIISLAVIIIYAKLPVTARRV